MQADDGQPDGTGPENHPLIGHETAEKAVLEAWNSGKFPHAWLITGPRGVGKASFALNVSRFILHHTSDAQQQGGGLFGDAPPPPDTLYTDPQSDLARRMASGGHADFRMICKREDKTVIQVEQTREIVDFAFKTSAEGGWRAVIVDAVDDMNPSSANALLKVLEEPPSKTLFLLISHAPGKLLPTIRSRCRALRLSPIEASGIVGLLSDVLGDGC